MTVKSLLSLFSGHPHEEAAISVSMALAATFTAEVRFLRIDKPLSAMPEFSGAMTYGQAFDRSATLLAECAVGGTGMADCNDRLEAFAKTHDVAFDRSTHVAPSVTGPRASFKSVVDRPDTCLAVEGRCCDMIVVAHHHPQTRDETDLLMSAIFQTGRPVLVVPERTKNADARLYAPGLVAVAWDGSLESARALACALPLLTGTPTVKLLCADEQSKHPTPAETDAITNWLYWHGHRIQIERLAAGHETVGKALVVRAGAVGADLLIAGAYGHGHDKDMLLGQVTQHILENMETPLLVSS